MIDRLKGLFEQIKGTSSRNDKIHILTANTDYSEFKQLLYFLKNPYITTGISSKRIKKKVKVEANITPCNIISLLDYICENNKGSDQDIAVVQSYLNSLDKEDREFVENIVTKSLKFGVDAKTINKAFGERFIPEFKCMLAEKYQDNMDFVKGKSFTITTKQDGIRVLAIKKNNSVKFFSRQGQPIEGLVDIESSLLFIDDDNFVIDGELMIEDDFGLLASSSANKYKETTKIVRKDGEKHGVEILAFDMLTIEEFENQRCDRPYKERRLIMEDVLSDLDCIEVLPALYSGEDVEQIDYWLKHEIERGEEGIMININDSLYMFKRTKCLLKYKVMQDCDVRCIGVEEGKGVFKGKLGAIVIEFPFNGSIYQTRCGSGFSIDDRKKYWENPELIVGKIVTIKYFEITQNDEGGYGLRFPKFKDISGKTEVSMF